jgi:hypothetical protein
MSGGEWKPRCVVRRGTECGDCVECLCTLPDGKTCADCLHIARCTALGYTDSRDNRFCSFHPRRAAFAQDGAA